MKYENMIIKIDKLKMSYGKSETKVDVLRGVDCIINEGEICALLGPSGSGKSTMLNIIGGLEKVQEGSVLVDGLKLQDISKKDLENYRRRELGFIFQTYNLVPDLTVKENIQVGAYLNDASMDVDEILRILGMEEHANKFPNQISGGQQQRTAIGRAIVKKPKILICDEPTGALDYDTAKDVLELIQRINDEYNTTVIMATHNTTLADMSHRVLKIHKGKIDDCGVKANLKKAEDLVW